MVERPTLTRKYNCSANKVDLSIVTGSPPGSALHMCSCARVFVGPPPLVPIGGLWEPFSNDLFDVLKREPNLLSVLVR
jgi:hypothetical protein